MGREMGMLLLMLMMDLRRTVPVARFILFALGSTSRACQLATVRGTRYLSATSNLHVLFYSTTS